MNFDFIELCFILCCILSIAVMIWSWLYFRKALEKQKRKLEQLQRYIAIEIGMSETEMLSIMGNGYNRSLLTNNRKKYEWRIEAQSFGTSHKGNSIRAYSGVKKVSIYTRNGYVDEVKPYNV